MNLPVFFVLSIFAQSVLVTSCIPPLLHFVITWIKWYLNDESPLHTYILLSFK